MVPRETIVAKIITGTNEEEISDVRKAIDKKLAHDLGKNATEVVFDVQLIASEMAQNIIRSGAAGDLEITPGKDGVSIEVAAVCDINPMRYQVNVDEDNLPDHGRGKPILERLCGEKNVLFWNDQDLNKFVMMAVRYFKDKNAA